MFKWKLIGDRRQEEKPAQYGSCSGLIHARSRATHAIILPSHAGIRMHSNQSSCRIAGIGMHSKNLAIPTMYLDLGSLLVMSIACITTIIHACGHAHQYRCRCGYTTSTVNVLNTTAAFILSSIRLCSYLSYEEVIHSGRSQQHTFNCLDIILEYCPPCLVFIGVIVSHQQERSKCVFHRKSTLHQLEESCCT